MEIVAEIIDSIAQTYRFSLTVEFLTDAERGVVSGWQKLCNNVNFCLVPECA